MRSPILTQKALQLFTGRVHPHLAADVAKWLDVDLGEATLVDFASGEVCCRFNRSVRGDDVFILQAHCETDTMSVNDAIMEQLVLLDAAKRASAKRVTAVIPYYGYSRQDRKSQGREPITAKMLADLLAAAGADRLMSVDLHSGQIQGFFSGPVDHLTAVPVLIDYLRYHVTPNCVVVAPDAGRMKVAERVASHLALSLSAVYKRRDPSVPNHVEALDVMGDVAGRTCIIVDDMIDTGGTVCAAADALTQRGANEVWIVATHALLSGGAPERLERSSVRKVIVTDTVPLPSSKCVKKIEVVSAAQTLADAIHAVFDESSVSEIFGGENQS